MEDAAAIIIIGNEILSGKVRDANGPFLLEELRALGQHVAEMRVIEDRVETIAETVLEMASRYTQVFTTGGVGPTLDDLTFEGVARAFGLSMHTDPVLEGVIREHVAEVTPGHLRMARVPEETNLIWSEGHPWPTTEVRNVLVFPGHPTLLRQKFSTVRERFRRTPFELRRLFVNLDEGALAPLLDAVFQAHPDVALGSYPVYDGRDYQVEITLESKDKTAVDAALAALLEHVGTEHVVRMESSP